MWKKCGCTRFGWSLKKTWQSLLFALGSPKLSCKKSVCPARETMWRGHAERGGTLRLHEGEQGNPESNWGSSHVNSSRSFQLPTALWTILAEASDTYFTSDTSEEASLDVLAPAEDMRSRDKPFLLCPVQCFWPTEFWETITMVVWSY